MMKQWLLPLWQALVGLPPEEPLKVVGKTDLDQGARRTVGIAVLMTAARALDPDLVNLVDLAGLAAREMVPPEVRKDLQALDLQALDPQVLDLTREAIRKAPVVLLAAHRALTEALKDRVAQVAPRQDQELNQDPLPVAQMAKLLSLHRS